MLKRVISVILTTAFMFSAAACGNGGGGADPGTDAGTETAGGEEPTEISIYFAFDGIDYPQPGNEVQNIIEEYTNTKLEITAYGTYTDMYPMILASGELPDIITALDTPLTKDMMRNGMFWDFTPYLDQFPNLTYEEATLENSRVDGMLIGIPKVRPLVRRTFIYRKDWADKLGIKKPTTIDEFYEMMRAFTFDDPDGNGKNDTYGLLADRSAATGHFTFYYDAPNSWKIDGETAVGAWETEEYLEGLKFVKKLREEGIIHPEWLIVDRNQFYNYFADGIGGVMRDSTNAIQMLAARVQAKFPEADVDTITVLESSSGQKRSIGESGHLGWLAVPKTVPEEKMLKILDFLNKMADEEMSTLMRWGIEGAHYNVANGIIVPIPEAANSYEDMVRYPYMLPFSVTDYDKVTRPGEYNKYVLMALDIEQNLLEYLEPNPTYTLDSQTMLEMTSTLLQIREDASIKFVEGEIDEEGFKAEIQRWRDTGGDKVREEYLESWNAQHAE